MPKPPSARGLIRPFETELQFTARLVDVSCVAIALLCANAVQGEAWGNSQSLAALLGAVVFYLSAHMTGFYRGYRGAPIGRELREVWLSWAAAFLVIVFLGFISKTSTEHSRRVVLTWAVLAPAMISTWRIALLLIAQEARVRGYNTRAVAIVGLSDLGNRLAQRIVRSPWMGLRVIGFFDDRGIARLEPKAAAEAQLRGGFDALVQGARSGEIDLVYITLPPRAEPRIADLIRRLSDTTASVYLAYDFGGFDLLRAQWSSVGDIPVMAVVENPFYGTDGVLKRLEDVVLGMVLCAVAGLPMLLIAIGVKLSSPGPVFFRQRRYGLNGEEIRVLKFRTMTVTEDGSTVTQATKGDVRITRFGALLRRTSLDEIPQLIQVVTGTMSLVGPRPHAVAHNEQYRSLIPGYMLRHKVKPGITGWAQVNGWRGETDTLEKMEKRVEYDLEYIRGWRLALDVHIILMTIRQVLFGHRNAY